MFGFASVFLVSALGAEPLQGNVAAEAQVQNEQLQIQMRNEDIRDQVVAFVSTIDTPITRTAWEALGSRAEPVLLELIANRDNFPTHRAKAIDGLAIVGGALAASLFREITMAESEPLVVRLAAVRGLGQVIDTLAQRAELQPLLVGAKDSRVRAYAGEVMIGRVGRSACAAVQTQAGTEQPEKAGQYKRALAQCD